MSRAKESQQNNENQQVVGAGSREDKEHCHDIIDEKEVVESVNRTNNDFSLLLVINVFHNHVLFIVYFDNRTNYLITFFLLVFRNCSCRINIMKQGIFRFRLDSPQVKQDLISGITNFVYELPYELPDKLKLRIFGNQEILGKSQSWLEAESSAQSSFQK